MGRALLVLFAVCRFGVTLWVLCVFVCFVFGGGGGGGGRRWCRSKADARVSEVRVGSPGSVRAGDAAAPRLRAGEA